MAGRIGWSSWLTQAFDLFHPVADPFFYAFICGAVVDTVAEIFRKALHIGDLAFYVVGVLIAFAVVQIFHQSGRGVAQMQGNGFGSGLFDIALDVAISGVQRVGFRCYRKIDDGLRECEIAFGHADKIHGIARGHAEGEGVGIGEADIFDGHANHAAGNVERIFTGFDHSSQPVQCGVGITVAHGFVQGGDEVVMFFAGFVVEQGAFLEGVANDVVGDLCGPSAGVLCQASGDFEDVVSAAGIAAGIAGDFFEDVVGGLQVHSAKAAVFIGESALEELHDLIFGQRLQNVYAAAGEQGTVDFERWIFGGGADEPDVALFHVREKCVLLGFVEAVDLVDEDDGAGAILADAFSVGHDLFDLFDSDEDGGEFDELRFCHACDNFGERGFAGAGWAPENERASVVALDLSAERLAGADELLLSRIFFKRAGAHPIGEGTAAVGGAGCVRSWVEESH